MVQRTRPTMNTRHHTVIVLALVALCVAIGMLPSPPAAAQGQARLSKQLIDGAWQAAGQAPTAQPASRPLSRAAAPSEYSSDPEEWTRLVFSTYRGGNWEIYRFVHIDNIYTTINLSNARFAQDTHPRLNRSADQIVFVSNRDRNTEIYRMDSNGAGQTRLTFAKAEDTQPIWSPDGQRIGFASRRDGNWNIYVMSADGSNPQPLTSDPANDIMPSWSPDGRTIAWVRAGTTSGAIWLMNADGSNARAITGQLTYLQHPSWSPDGSRLAFDYDRDGDGFNDLALINPDGSGMRPVAVTENYIGPGQRGDLAVGGWSPEGDRLLIGVAIYRLTSPPKLANMFVGRILASGGAPFALISPIYDAMPDMRSLDLDPPQTRLAELPAFTRAGETQLEWSGDDVGIAGLAGYDVQYRVGAAGAWTGWRTRTTDLTGIYTGAAGSSVAFRVRGRDQAGNLEPWRSRAGGEVATTFFTWALAGSVTDNRGAPVPAASLSLTPAAIDPIATDVQGRYLAYLQASGNHTALPAHVGYQSPPATTLAMQQDRAFRPYLLPLDSTVQNGGFEAGATPTGWTISGTLPISITTDAHTGARAVRLGQPCPLPCLIAQEPIPATRSAGTPYIGGMVIDAGGTVHLLWQQPDLNHFPDWQIFYQTRSPAGVWSTATPLAHGTSSQLAIDGQQRLHAIWVTPDHRLHYRQRLAAGGAWSAPDDLGLANEGRIYADRAGKVYVFFYCYSILGCDNTGAGQYRIRPAGGSWQAPHPTPTTWAVIAFGPDDTAYIAWDGAHNGSFAAIQPDGSLGEIETFAKSYQVYQPQLAIDGQGTIQIVWAVNADLYVVSRQPGAPWPQPQKLALGGAPLRLASHGGTVYLANQADQLFGYGLYLRALRGGSGWSAPVKLANGVQPFPWLLASDSQDRAHLVLDDFAYQVTRSSAAGAAALSQTVSVSAGMHRPTLAFDYALAGVTASTGSRLLVSVQGTPVYSATVGSDWAHAAIDMQAWAGQSVAVTVALEQAQGSAQASALIDDISLGSWRTPIIQQVTPAAVANPGGATQIEIVGENFLATPSVRLGTTTLTEVELVDAQTLRVTIPAGVKPGRYSLWVTNPGGQAALWPLLPLGRQLMVPIAAP